MKPSERIGDLIEWRELLAVLDEMHERIALLQPATDPLLVNRMQDLRERVEGAGRKEPSETLRPDDDVPRVVRTFGAGAELAVPGVTITVQGQGGNDTDRTRHVVNAIVVALHPKQAEGWIKCSERMPEIGETVLFYGRSGALLGQTFRVRCGEFSAPSFPDGEGKSPYWIDRLSVDLNGRAQTLRADLVLYWRPLPEGPTT